MPIKIAFSDFVMGKASRINKRRGGLRDSTSRSLSCPLMLLAALGTHSTLKADVIFPLDDAEPNSPSEMSPGLVEPGLSQYAIPSPQPPPEPPELDLQSFYSLTHPFDNASLLSPLPGPFSPPDPSSFRPVTIYSPPLGLRPQIYRTGLVEWYPWAGVAQSFESNIQETPHNPISDFFFTPSFGLEAQIGTPDSIYNEFYNTVFSANVSYEGYADLFYQHPNFDAYNQILNFNGRIGRASFMVRPFVNFSEITGNNIQVNESQNRTEREQITGGVTGEYDFTPVTGWRQTYTDFVFDHRDPDYINYNTLSTRQELTYLMPSDQIKGILWAEAKTTQPSAGFGGNEYLAGFGWQGKFNPRLSSELWLGWGELQMFGDVPGRENLSGLRYSGHTSFDYSSRVRFTLGYYRDYAFNEVAKNDNYMATLTQFLVEMYMGDRWFVIPALNCSLDDYEISPLQTVEWQPQMEIAYVFAKEDYKIMSVQDTLVGSRVFLKLTYDYTDTLRGSGAPISDFRASVGVNWNF